MSAPWTKNEDDFQGLLISTNRRLFMPKLYPKVTRIAGNYISPEIDLLGVDKTRGYVVGYEFKILNTLKKGFNYRRIHSGIGQTLCYFSFGVDFAYLILGIPKTIHSENYSNKISDIEKLIVFLSQNHSFDRFQIWTYDGNTVRHPAANVRSERKVVDTKAQLSRDNILNGNFTWTKGKKFLTKYDIEMW